MIVYGKNVARELLENDQKITKAYIYDKFDDKKTINLLRKQNVTLEFCSKKELDTIAKGKHQGIILSIPDYDFVHLKS